MKGNKIILIVCVVVMGYAGVSYAAWTDSLKIETLLTSGEVNVAFTDCELKTDRDKKDSLNEELDWIDVKIINNVLEITGEVTPGFKGKVQYRLLNNSTMPVKYLPEGKKQTIKNGGMCITLHEKETVIDATENMPKDNGWGQFQIDFERSDKHEYVYPEKYDYNIYLPFVQYNLTSGGGWNEKLKIHVEITVVEELAAPELEPIVPELELINENVAEPQGGNASEVETVPEVDPIMNFDQQESDTDLADNEQADGTPDGSEIKSTIDEDENEDSSGTEIQTENGDSAETELQTETENEDVIDHDAMEESIENTEGGE